MRLQRAARRAASCSSRWRKGRRRSKGSARSCRLGGNDANSRQKRYKAAGLHFALHNTRSVPCATSRLGLPKLSTSCPRRAGRPSYRGLGSPYPCPCPCSHDPYRAGRARPPRLDPCLVRGSRARSCRPPSAHPPASTTGPRRGPGHSCADRGRPFSDSCCARGARGSGLSRGGIPLDGRPAGRRRRASCSVPGCCRS